MANSEDHSDYTERVGHIFDRLQALNRDTEEDKVVKHRHSLELISKFQQTLGSVQQQNSELIGMTNRKLQHLSESVRQHEHKLSSNTESLANVMKKLTTSVKQTITRYDKQMEMAEKAIRDKIRNHISRLTEEAGRRGKSHAQNLANYKELVEIAGPQLMKELKCQKTLRQQIQERILEQFETQINDLRELIKIESQLREKDEEQLVHFIRETSLAMQGMLRRQTEARKDSENSLSRLLETVVDKIRYEILE